MTSVLHASLAAAFHEGRWRGALLLGPSGAGKSDLLLRLTADGWRLVADDRVEAWPSGGAAFGRAPASLSGWLELRGQGMARLPPLASVRITVAVELGETEERQPEPAHLELAGVRLPRHRLRPFDASAPARLRLLLHDAV